MNTHSRTERFTDAAADKVREAAFEATNRVEEEITTAAQEFAQDQRRKANNYIADLGKATEAAIASLREDGHFETAEKLAPVSNLLRQTSASIANYNLQSVVDDATDVARRNPALTFGLAALAGYAIVRLARPAKRELGYELDD